MSSSLITWLHISDTHIGDHRHTWDAYPVLRRLPDDLRHLQERHELRPDFVVFTGDIAYGQRSGNPLSEQYREVATFLEAVCNAFTPRLERSSLYLVPGNHDVNRDLVTEDQTQWLLALVDDPQACEKVEQMMRAQNVQWKRYMERLSDYRRFLENEGFTHLLADHDRLIFGARIDLGRLSVGIAGVNTAWSCGRENEKGQLWMGAWQLKYCLRAIEGADLTLLLTHHPMSWLTTHEDPQLVREITRDFDFHLHGHEHDEWVSAELGHVRVSAGAAYDHARTTHSYNMVRLFPTDRRVDVYLRSFDRQGQGWVPQFVAGKTSEAGVWRIENPRLLPRLRLGGVVERDTPPVAVAIAHAPAEPADTSIDVFQFFSPASEVDSLDRFVGRRVEIETGLHALRSAGASIVIFGPAGVGKTSLALLLARIARGDQNELLAKMRLAHLAPPGGFRHPVVYYSCRVDDTSENILASLLADGRPDLSIGSLLQGLAASRAPRAAPEFDTAFHTEAAEGDRLDDLIRRFRNVTASIVAAYGDRPLLIVLDEFNLAKDRRGLAEMIKELHFLKFVIVGTAFDVRLLVQEHGSVPRQFSEGQIRVRRMSNSELQSILTAEVDRSDGRFRFSHDAATAIVDASRGMPYFTHWLGRYSLAEALRRISEPLQFPISVEKEDVVAAVGARLKDLADLDARYIDIVRPGKRDAWKREFFLKVLSLREEDDVSLANIRTFAASQGLANVRHCAEMFVGREVLEQTGNASFRFSDFRLKVFARLREFLTDEARNRIEHLRSRVRDSESTGFWTGYSLPPSG